MFDEDVIIDVIRTLFYGGMVVGMVFCLFLLGYAILLYWAAILLFIASFWVGKYVKKVFGRRGLIIHYVISFLVFLVFIILVNKGPETSSQEVSKTSSQEVEESQRAENLLYVTATNDTEGVSVSIGKVKINISTNLLERLPKLPFGKGKAKEGESK